ncbi:hypothetical protein Ancab_034812 [Ancistrocladus abbreviatus]
MSKAVEVRVVEDQVDLEEADQLDLEEADQLDLEVADLVDLVEEDLEVEDPFLLIFCVQLQPRQNGWYIKRMEKGGAEIA